MSGKSQEQDRGMETGVSLGSSGSDLGDAAGSGGRGRGAALVVTSQPLKDENQQAFDANSNNSNNQDNDDNFTNYDSSSSPFDSPLDQSRVRTLSTIVKERQAELNRKEAASLLAWANTFLQQRSLSAREFAEDYSDGVLLINLLEVSLNFQVGKYSMRPKNAALKLDNVVTALDAMDKKNIKLLSISPHDIVAKKEKPIIIVLFSLLRFLSLQGIGLINNNNSNVNIKENLLEWCQNSFSNLEKINDFWSSFRNGKAFCAIVNKVCPGVINMNALSDSPIENIKLAFTTAEKELGIPAFLSPEDFLNEKGDEKAVMNYVCMLVSAAKASHAHTTAREVEVNLLNEKLKEAEAATLLKAQQADEETKRLTQALETNEQALQNASDNEKKWREASNKWRESARKWRDTSEKWKKDNEDKAAELAKLKADHENEIHRLNAELYRQHREHEEVLARIRDDKIRDITEVKSSKLNSARDRSRTLAVKKAIKQAASDHDLLMGMEVVKGWLYRRRPHAMFHASRFKKVFFILRGDSLEYYHEEGGKLKGSFSLSDYKLAFELDEKDGLEIIIRIDTISSAEKSTRENNVIDFRATPEEAVNRKLQINEATRFWLDALNTRIALHQYIKKKEQKRGTGWGVPELVHFITDPHATELVIEDRINLREPLNTLKPALVSQSRLMFISLVDCSLEDESVSVIADILRSNSVITALDLSNNLIGPDGASYLMGGLLENSSLNRLTLDHNQLGDDGVVRLSQAVQVHPGLSEINLVGNGVGDEGVVALCKALLASQAQKGDVPHPFPVVNLAHNLVGDKGCSALADLITKNPTVKRLNLDHNIIGDEGLKSLSRALTVTNAQLKGVYLSSNQISSRGLLSLATALKSMSGEIMVDLSDNKLVSRSGIGAIVDAELSLDYKLLKVFKPAHGSSTEKSLKSVTFNPAASGTTKNNSSDGTSKSGNNSKSNSTTASPVLKVKSVTKGVLKEEKPFEEKPSIERRVSFNASVLVASPIIPSTNDQNQPEHEQDHDLVHEGDENDNEEVSDNNNLNIKNENDDNESSISRSIEEYVPAVGQLNIDANAHARKSPRSSNQKDKQSQSATTLAEATEPGTETVSKVNPALINSVEIGDLDMEELDRIANQRNAEYLGK